MKTLQVPAAFRAPLVFALGVLTTIACGMSIAVGTEREPAAAGTDAGPSDADYCTVLYSAKLQSDLNLTDAQRDKIGELKDRLKAMLENAANPAAVHGPRGRSDTRARTLGKRGGVVLSKIGPDIKRLLTPGQERKLTDLYTQGRLRPIEVVAAEVHGRTTTLNYVAIGRVGILCHYDEPAAKQNGSADSPTLGSVHGKNVDGSFYRDTHPTSHPHASTQPGKVVGKDKESEDKANPDSSASAEELSEEQLSDLVADLRSGDSKRSGAALTRLVRTKTVKPSGKVARALETILLKDTSAENRSNAAAALGAWGTRASLPKLKQASNDSSPLVQSRAKQAIEVINASEL